VARDVDGSLAAGDDLDTHLREAVHDAEDGLLVARHERGGEQHGVALGEVDLAVLPAGHAGQAGHRLALRAGGDDHQLLGRQLGRVVHVDDDLARIGEQAHLLGDLHVAQHRPPVERDLAARRVRGVDDRLHAVNVGGEARDDDELARVGDEPLQRPLDPRLRRADARGGGVGRVEQQQVDAGVAEAGHRRQVGRASVRRELVELDVAGHHDGLVTDVDDDAEAVRDRVVDREVLGRERPEGVAPGGVDLHELRLDAVLTALGRHQRERERRAHHRDVGAQLEQERDGADVVLVTVREHERLDLVEAVLDVPEVGEDEVDARLGRAREEHAAVDDQQLAVVLEDGHVAADLGDAAEGDDAQRALARLGRCGQADGHVAALHGLDAAELGRRGLAAAAAAASTTASAAATAGVAATARVATGATAPAAARVAVAAAVVAVAVAVAATGTTAPAAAVAPGVVAAPGVAGAVVAAVPAAAATAALLTRGLGRGRDGRGLGELHGRGDRRRRGGRLRVLGRGAAGAAHLAPSAGAVGGFRHLITPALDSSDASASRCSVVGGS